MPELLSVNIAVPKVVDYTDAEFTGIDKRPIDTMVKIVAPGPQGTADSGLAGDRIGDKRFHGGDHQAVYAYAREDLDHWERELGKPLANGSFGENFTVAGLDVNGALVGERWRVGPDVLLEVTSPRIPCRTFQEWLEEPGWVKRFTQAARPGAYLRVVRPGEVRAGDQVTVEHRPEHEVTVALVLRALSGEPELLPRVLAAGEALNPEHAASVRKRLERRAVARDA
ncbi:MULTISPECIES: MOSC domain-containing protein [Streptomycetaceae]|uniref:MOSC domain-containing protein n=1 Tax=Streptantibioticus cattleyicolor (strain ATCC 35852 / DSM 46488 / JCM 4925 / NBRC 14057 / NRRL 8057) TaxID=1003195 RepID=F8JZD5_STREN|nr:MULTISPECIES: MOSC domain-containing protein [Streptomycetaceae]AEW96016.1 hypothetical protein SCATT_36450 [Streptantibioticus cattleyicolor NRRL 8057 = DSM 46488]MYS60547.1 MOSC domain-containing protein [Streptomyces sp. SID5468]CCB76348.1 conserved protein of unknown function [Streptantibioticus cattleyicolor NRRL 8057 = DSM 46488]